MSNSMSSIAGNAFVWKFLQMGFNQTINLVRTLILARLLLPEDFGLIAIALVAINTIQNITDFGMIPALVQYKEIKAEFYDAAWTIGVARATLITTTVFISAPLIADLFKEPLAIQIIRSLAFRPLIESLASVKVAELTRKLNFRILSFINIPPVIIEMIISVSMAKLLGVWALVIGALSGASSLVFFSYLLAPYRPSFNLNSKIIRPLIQFGRWVFLSKIVAASGSSVLQVIISRQFGSASLGIYFLAIRLAFLPNEISAKVIGEIAFPLYSHYQADLYKLKKAFQTILIGMAALLFPVFAILFALAPILTNEVLGSRWSGTAPIIRILALAGMVGLFGDAVGPLFKGKGQPYKVVLLEFSQFVIIILFISGLINQFGLAGAAFAWLLAISCSQLIALLLIHRQLPAPFLGLGIPIIGVILAFTASVLVGLGSSLLITGLFGFGFAVFLSLLTFSIVLWYFERSFHLKLVQTFLNAFPQFSLVLHKLHILQKPS